MELRFIGCGDAFGTGGRSNTCFHLTDGRLNVLIDCGASAPPALKRWQLGISAIDAILLSHLHGDHFGGVPFLLLEASFAAPRAAPLVIAGPSGTEARIMTTLEGLFPGAAPRVRERVAVRFVEYRLGDHNALAIGDDTLDVLPLEVAHPSGAPSCALRIRWHDRVVAFSGDTEWTEALLAVARSADLFICECYAFEKGVPFHLNYRTIERRLADLAPRRIILTHFGAEMIGRRDTIAMECAEDGQLTTI